MKWVWLFLWVCGDLFSALALLEDNVQARVYLCQWITVSLLWVDLSLSMMIAAL